MLYKYFDVFLIIFYKKHYANVCKTGYISCLCFSCVCLKQGLNIKYF